DEADGREVLHAAETRRLHVAQKELHDPKRIRTADAGQDRRVVNNRQDFASHVHDDLVSVAVGHHATEAAAAGHTEPAGIVDDDQVNAAGFSTLGADARTGAAADDRLAGGDLSTE